MLFPVEWELLAHSLKRVKAATGLSENEAQMGLCQGIARGAIAIRFAPTYVECFKSWSINPNIFVSPHLAPDDIDWLGSRPMKRSAVGTAAFQSGSWAEEDRLMLELSADDVDEFFEITNKSAEAEDQNSAPEIQAAKALARLLKERPSLTRAEARSWCNETGFELSGRAFQNRVWPDARKIAGLDRRAPPGRKAKTSR
jgi:hypothetical protein